MIAFYTYTPSLSATKRKKEKRPFYLLQKSEGKGRGGGEKEEGQKISILIYSKFSPPLSIPKRKELKKKEGIELELCQHAFAKRFIRWYRGKKRREKTEKRL